MSKWGEEEWQTKEGSADAKQEDGTQKRYLPKKAWENMSEEEKQATDEKKQEGSKQGKQYVENTDEAKESRQKANNKEHEKYEEKKAKEREKSNGDAEDGAEGEEAAEDNPDEEYVIPNGTALGTSVLNRSLAERRLITGTSRHGYVSNIQLIVAERVDPPRTVPLRGSSTRRSAC